MGDHHHDQTTAELLGQDIAPASEIVAGCPNGNEDGHATEGDEAGGLEGEASSAVFDRAQLNSLFGKRSQHNYEPVLTREHDGLYRTILRNRALHYAEQGLYVFPCRPMDILDENGEIKHKAKSPLTKNGHKDATIDRAQIARRWSELRNTGFPDALIGIRTGLISGFWVLDIDTKNADGFASLKKLEARFGALPATHTVKTPSGGVHYYWKFPDIDLRCSSNKIAPGIDVRANDGYVIGPPSMMVDGRAYEDLTDATPNEAAWAPSWLIDLGHSEQ